MKQYLIKTSTNWADEIDLEGFTILDEKKLEEAKKEIAELVDDDFYACVYVGTNEDMDVSAEDVLDELNSAVLLSPEEYKILNSHFGKVYGFSLYEHFINCSSIDDYYEEKEEEIEKENEQKKIDARFDEVKSLF